MSSVLLNILANLNYNEIILGLDNANNKCSTISHKYNLKFNLETLNDNIISFCVIKI
jgi:hypothetical protein